MWDKIHASIPPDCPRSWIGHTRIHDFIHCHYLNYARLPKILDRAYKIYNFIHCHCLNYARLPKILDRAYKIHCFLLVITSIMPDCPRS